MGRHKECTSSALHSQLPAHWGIARRGIIKTESPEWCRELLQMVKLLLKEHRGKKYSKIVVFCSIFFKYVV